MSVPTAAPSTAKSTAVTPTSSDAVAASVTLPTTVDPSTGAVMAAWGADASGVAVVTTTCGRCAAAPSREVKIAPSLAVDAMRIE